MFGWIDRLFHWGLSNVGGTVVGWVRDGFHGLWGFLASIFGNVTVAWHDVFAAANWIWTQAQDFGNAVYTRFVHLYHIVIPAVVRWAERELHALSVFALHAWQWTVHETVRLWQGLIHLRNDLVSWIVRDIWRPLTDSIGKAWKWIFHEGAIVWFYITHPDKLIDLLWDSLIAKLETEAWTVGSKLGSFFLGLILHNLKRFALLLEDIIVSVL